MNLKIVTKQIMPSILRGLIAVLLIFSIPSCDDIVEYSPIPDLTFISTKVIDSTDILGNQKTYVELLFSVVDGDGDVGLNEYDTLSPFTGMYQYNFFSTLFYVQDGLYDSSGLADYNYRIPYIEIENHKAYKAEITVEFEYFNHQLLADTLSFDFFIVDRALNHSDTLRTPPISIYSQRK
jgi:hypothetical protein